MKKIFAAALALSLSCGPALAQSSPGLVFGQVPTAGQWNGYFANKQDFLGAASCIVTGCVLTGELVTAAPTTSSSGFNLQPGVSPTTPANGDTWMTSAAVFFRVNGQTLSLSVGQITGTATNDNAAAGNVGEYQEASCPGSASTATVTITIASPGVITWTGNPFFGVGTQQACPVVFTTSGSLPTGLTAGTTYWVLPGVSLTANTFEVATSVANALAGTPVNTSGTQSGTQTATAGSSLVTATPKDVTGLALTAGDWDCRASLVHNLAGTTSVTILKASLVTTSGTDGSLTTGTMQQFSTAANVMGGPTSQVVGPRRFSLAAPTNVFLDADDTFTVSTDVGSGSLSCRRAR